MTDSPTTRKRLRKQSLGSNTNTWGDTKLNEVLDVLDQIIDGYVAIALTGDLDLSASTTNYTTSDNTKYRWQKFTGTLSASATITYPAVSGWYLVTNASGQTLTLKLSASTGVTLPNSRTALIFCDGSDIYSGVSNYQPTPVSALTNSGDLATYSQIQALIANASIPAATGAILNSASDTTAGYLSAKLDTAGSGELAVSTESPAGNEKSLFTFTRDEGQIALHDSIMAL